MILKTEKKQLIIFGVILLIVPIILLNLHGGLYYLGILIPIGIYSLTAIGLSLLIGFAGQISLGHAAFMAIGAYSSALISNKLGYHPVLGILLSILLNIIIGYIISKPILKLKGHYLAMATLGVGIIFHILFREANYLGAGEGISIPDLKIFGHNFNEYSHKEMSYYYLVWTINFIIIILTLNFINSKVGRALKALHINELAAQSLGINCAKYKTFVFMFSSVLAGISGSLLAHYNSYILPSNFDFYTSIKIVSMVILGGVTSVWGAVLGCFLLMILPEFLGEFDEVEHLIYGGVIVSVMIFFPEGLMSLFKKLNKINKVNKLK
jgi:branched-chain amino acid transport system permease protein